MAMEPLARPPGASFAPEDGDLITLYLGPKIAGEPLPSATAPYIHDHDVYAAEPAALVSGLLHASVARNGREISDEWYFYTSVRAKSGRDSRRCRAVAGGAGTWHSEKARQQIVNQEEDRVIGYRQSFTYEPKNGWLMTEYTLVDQEGGRGESMPVLSKIYRSPHAGAAAIQSASKSKKRKAAVERSGAGSSGRVRRRLQFPFPPPAPSPCAVVAPAASEFLLPTEAPAEKKAEDEFLLPIEAPADKKAEDEFLLAIESQAEKKAEDEFLVPIESQAVQEAEQLRGFEMQQQPLARAGEESQGEFLVPIESQAEQEAEQLRGFETQQEPLASMASSRASLISRFPMAVRYALAGALASVGRPFEDWATEDEINSHYGDASPLMAIPPYDSTWELNYSHVSSFPPSALTSYSPTLSPSALYWDTPENSHGVDASTLLSGDQAYLGMSCYGATSLRSNGAGAWATPPSSELLPGSWTGGHLCF